MAYKYWDLASGSLKEASVLAEQLGLSLLAAEILAARGLTLSQAEAFLSDQAPLSDPMEYQDMDKAVSRIEQAVDTGERITIYGDYDADGVTATVLLYHYLDSLGADVSYYIPKRDGEGYGINCDALEKLKKFGTQLLVTVDNGITAIQEAERCKELGIDLVITDHHKPTEQLPEAAAVVDPHRKDCQGPFKDLAGVGVAFKLVCAMERSNEEMLEFYSDLVAIGTIGDVVPLTGENRAIVKAGLEKLSQHDNPGIEALRSTAGTGEGPLTASQLAFQLVPRINAAGRLGSAAEAVNLLLTQEPEDALGYAQQINETNRRRKDLEQAILEDIEQKIQQNPSLLKERLLILSGTGWHHGVIGIVASRLMECYAKPCVLIAVEGLEARGSARSLGDFSLFEALSYSKETLTRFGGHTLAAGFSLNVSKISSFCDKMQEYARISHSYMPPLSLRVDRELTFSRLTLEECSSLEILEPFGAGNEPPLFLLREVKVTGVYPMSQGKHLRLRLSKEGEEVYAVWFGMSPERFGSAVGETVDLVCSAEPNEYNGETRLSIKIRDLRPSGVDWEQYWTDLQTYEKLLRHEPLTQQEYQRVLPDRGDVATVYRYFKSKGKLPADFDQLAVRLSPMPYCKIRVCTEILKELRLIALRDIILVNPNPQKTDIESSRLLQRLRNMESVRCQ